MNGKLYGIGVGPGAPDLLTLRAAKVLGRVAVALAAASPRNDYSIALRTVRSHLRADAEIVRLEFPMTRERAVLREAWSVAAARTAEILRSGRDAAFLTIGDPLIYSTFGYLSRALRESAPELEVEIIPGITSFQAAAARTGATLCEGAESLLILPGINDAEELGRGLAAADNSVVLKAYRNFPAIREALRAAGRAHNAVFVSKVCLEDEMISRRIEALPDVPPYLSLVLAKKG